MSRENNTKFCPHCGVMIDYHMEYCPSCGKRQPSLNFEPEKHIKNPIIAGLLSLLVTGLGHLYVGHRRRALFFFFGTLATGIILERFLSFEQVMLIGFFIAILSAIDAYQIAKKT